MNKSQLKLEVLLEVCNFRLSLFLRTLESLIEWGANKPFDPFIRIIIRKADQKHSINYRLDGAF